MLFRNYIYKYTIFQHKKSTIGDWRERPKHELLRDLKYDVRYSKDGPLLSPARYEGKRNDDNVKEITMLSFDIDTGALYKEPVNFESDWICYTTYSHTTEKPKWRLFIPLKRYIPASEWKYAWKAACDLFYKLYPGEEYKNCLDKTCKNASRMYYLPSVHPDTAAQRRLAVQLRGKLYTLNYDYVIHAEMTRKREKEELQKIREKKRRFNLKHRNKHPILRELKQELFQEYATNENYRTALAQQLGLNITGGRAEGFVCPTCGRNDATFFYINPDGGHMAYCRHMESCGSPGTMSRLSLLRLAEINNIT